MSDLNKIESALERRAEKELKEVVNRFMADIDAISNKYRLALTGFYTVKKADGSFKTYVNRAEFSLMLNETLKERFIERMVQIKSEELLRKVDLYE